MSSPREHPQSDPGRQESSSTNESEDDSTQCALDSCAFMLMYNHRCNFTKALLGLMTGSPEQRFREVLAGYLLSSSNGDKARRIASRRLPRYLQDHVEAAETLAIGAMADAIERRATIEKFWPYYFGIIDKKAADIARFWTPKCGSLTDGFDVQDPKGSDPQDAADSEEQTRRILKLIETALNQDQQDVLNAHLQDKSDEEIAKSLGIPVGTVKTRLHRARKILGLHLRP